MRRGAGGSRVLLDLGRPDDSVGRLIALALEEDVGPGDRTAEACVSAEARGTALIVAKEPLVVSGVSAAARVFRALDPDCELEALLGEGDLADAGAGVLRVRGRLRALLSGERTALNLLQRLCGVATLTRKYVEALRGARTRLLDTRKTTPGMRQLEKAAVRAGGGSNHRGALFDGILVKDNHAAAAGGIAEAVRRAKAAASPFLRVEAEVSTPEQIEEALAAGADLLLLDNLGDRELAAAVKQVAGRAPTEASGGVTLDRLQRIAACGVDYVSVGALTHSAPAVDLSLVVEGRA
jgi:nicotinate-nucleotide pyrophosphorylase (carboxylating)